MAEKLSERLERIVRAPGIANHPAYTDAIREAIELARRVEGAAVAVAGASPGRFYYTADSEPVEHGQRVRLVPEPPGQEVPDA